MPTGYTYPVADGKITEFSDFAMTCARAFGALVQMRDDPTDAPIPEEFKPSNFYSDYLAAAQKRLVKLRAMSDDEAKAAALAEYEKALLDRQSSRDRYAQEDARMLAMREKVNAWTPPTPDHIEMKKFMLNQLDISLNGDMSRYMDQPKLLDGYAWRAQAITAEIKNVARYTEEVEKENQRARDRTNWVKALRESLAA